MKKSRWFLLASSFCAGLFSGQEIKQIDTINIRKSIIHHQSKVKVGISRKELDKVGGDNLANVLKNASGVTILQNGANISKPVIQGLTNQRIMMLNNGVKIESQQWGNDHSPEIDPFLAQNIEVVKGAEAVKYGANAMGGVVLLKSEKLPYFGEKIGGKFQLIGESNTEKWAGNIMLQGNLHKNNAFAWRIQSSAKKSGNYHTADYIVENTGAREFNYSTYLGYKMPKEKIELFYSFFSTKLGVYSGSRIGSQEDWELRFLEGRPMDKGFFSYDIGFPKQEVSHHLSKINLESSRFWGNLNLAYTFQKNHRQEYDRRRGSFAHKPTFDVELFTHTASLDYNMPHHHYFKFYLGGAVSHQENLNISGNGINSILPNFLSNNAGVYFSEEFKKDSWLFLAGIRYDYKTFNAAGYDYLGNYYSGDKVFSNWSYNVGVHKTFGEKFTLISNWGMAWRAPEAIELFSKGVHHGSAFYIQGNEKLNLEKGWKWSTKFNFVSNNFSASVDVFLQKIKGFIYEMPTHTYINTWSGYFPIFEYKQSDALFRGGDLELKYKLNSWLNYDAKFSVVYASNLTEKYYFPYISPENLRQKFSFKLDEIIPLNEAYLELEHYWANQQYRFSPEADLIPFTPPAYHLFNASMGANISIFNQNDMSVSLTVNNLLNRLYKDYTDRFRYFAHGMGRNIQFRLNYNF